MLATASFPYPCHGPHKTWRPPNCLRNRLRISKKSTNYSRVSSRTCRSGERRRYTSLRCSGVHSSSVRIGVAISRIAARYTTFRRKIFSCRDVRLEVIRGIVLAVTNIKARLLLVTSYDGLAKETRSRSEKKAPASSSALARSSHRAGMEIQRGPSLLWTREGNCLFQCQWSKQDIVKVNLYFLFAFTSSHLPAAFNSRTSHKYKTLSNLFSRSNIQSTFSQ